MRHKIVGERIFLHRYEIDFTEKLFEAAMESRGGEFTRWMPWCHENYSIEDSRSFVKLVVDEWEKEMRFGFAIFDTISGEFLGGIGLNQYNDTHKFINLGYWIRTSRQNRGFASEATRLLARAGFEDLPINRIEILAAIENTASHRVAEKAGATREGVLRKRLLIGGRVHDAVMFSFAREDFNL
ncbi:MAG TPA: GNAT family protein [Pyrinomonadaceae bacterium]|nr:GNAT family protein [Pyrinomonadaceae bacterium]